MRSNYVELSHELNALKIALNESFLASAKEIALLRSQLEEANGTHSF